MNIGMLLESGYPTDIRVAKEAQCLTEAGHTVFLLSETVPDRPPREEVDGVVVVRRPFTENEWSPGHFLARTRWVLTNVDTEWARETRGLIEREGIDVLHVHDLPLVGTALAVGDECDVPVVADLHENWPEAVRQYRSTRPWHPVRNPRDSALRLLQPVWRWKRIERACVRRADRVITVVEEAREHYLVDCGADPERTAVVSNVVQLDKFDAADVRPIGFEDDFVVSYVGTLGGRHRGLHTVVEAMPTVLERAPDARLLIVGGGEPYGSYLRERSAELGVDDRVTFTGQVPFAEVPSYIAGSDLCLVPHISSGHTESTMPHKLFQYMAMRKPVLVTDVAPLARVVRGADAGVVVPPEEPTPMAAAIVSLAGDRERCRALGERGREAVETRYNWARESERLIECYRGLDGNDPVERGRAVRSTPSAGR